MYIAVIIGAKLFVRCMCSMKRSNFEKHLMYDGYSSMKMSNMYTLQVNGTLAFYMKANTFAAHLSLVKFTTQTLCKYVELFIWQSSVS